MKVTIIPVFEFNAERTFTYGGLCQAARYRNHHGELRYIVPSGIGYNCEDGLELLELDAKTFRKRFSLKPVTIQPAPPPAA